MGSIKHAIVGFFSHLDQLHGSNSTHGELFLHKTGGLKLGTPPRSTGDHGGHRLKSFEVENRGAENLQSNFRHIKSQIEHIAGFYVTYHIPSISIHQYINTSMHLIVSP